MQHRDVVTAAAFLPDGKLVATASRGQTVQFWQVPTPVAGPPEHVQAEMESLTGMELDERGTVRPRWDTEGLERPRSLSATPGPGTSSAVP